MDLGIKDHFFIVGGATSGFGKAVAVALLNEGARILALARREDLLQALQNDFPNQVETLATDITSPEAIPAIVQKLGAKQLHGALINAGGPPAKTVLETTMEDWDNAYRTVLRWKVDLVKQLVPRMQDKNYGRLLFIESASVKEPI